MSVIAKSWMRREEQDELVGKRGVVVLEWVNEEDGGKATH